MADDAGLPSEGGGGTEAPGAGGNNPGSRGHSPSGDVDLGARHGSGRPSRVRLRQTSARYPQQGPTERVWPDPRPPQGREEGAWPGVRAP